MRAPSPATPRPLTQLPGWLLGVAAVLLLAGALGALALLAGPSLPERNGPPVEQLAVESTVLTPGAIELTVRNTGPDPVQVAQVFVNDAYVDATGAIEPIGRLGTDTLRLDYPWLDGQPYLISLVTSSGVVLEHEIDAAVATTRAGPEFFGLMALLGTYVGILPVLMGMLLLPLLRRAGRATVRVLLAVTVGLLAYLAVDGTAEGFEQAGTGGAFGGATLVVLGAALAFLVLSAVDRWVRARRQAADGSLGGARLAFMLALGIGLHNLGEGLAIGSAYAVGELALGAALVLGFALHNTTEGIAVVAPLADERPGVLRLLGLGLLAGAPAILGALIGAAVNNAELSAFLLGVGVGAIAQVIVQVLPAVRERVGAALDPLAIAGVAGGVLLMYGTALLVPA
ncbi:MAG: Zinc transporter, ZIP family [uncultured Friedmanniella sp.]|uniref:Zinc transporter, ZIP family n=1 Tax=uncultured Friedmanniella sp. TaxID=335381 RepID=A0A6J4LA14_9ACTN|nr:ZIP family metal transporter [uncultured Friedmanniella sp.]CAA9325249.1 MAG: Zinc transporter, ZIP family [uncultured Friedmanniella sp.]